MSVIKLVFVFEIDEDVAAEFIAFVAKDGRSFETVAQEAIQGYLDALNQPVSLTEKSREGP